MSGGHFNYIQNKIDDAALEVNQKIKDYAKSCTPQTLERFAETAAILERAGKMLQRVDWFISCDDGEESFNRRWIEDGL